MKLVVFGASGRVGRLVVDGALKGGHQVTAFTRNSANIRVKHKNLRISGGNVSDDNAVREAMKGQQVAVVAIGAKDISRPHSVAGDGVKRIIAAAGLHNVPRIVMLGNLGLLPHPSGKLLGEVNIAPFLQFIYADQKTAYTELKDSGLDWVMVCPPFMPQGAATGKFRQSVDAVLEKAQQISVEDVANVLLAEAVAPRHHNVRVGVSY